MFSCKSIFLADTTNKHVKLPTDGRASEYEMWFIDFSHGGVCISSVNKFREIDDRHMYDL